MSYKRDIELVFDIASFQPRRASSQIDLWYIADGRESNPIPKTAEKEFFLQCIRDHVRALPQSRTKVSEVLEIVRSGWEKALSVSSQIYRVNVAFPVSVAKTSDSSIAVTSSLLLVPLETRVEIVLHLSSCGGPDGVGVALSPEAKVLYGENFNIGKIKELLSPRFGQSIGMQEEDWSDVLAELHAKLIARGKK